MTGEAAAHRNGATGNGQFAPAPSDPYSNGMADWRDLKAWSDAQTGEAGAGVRYWEANRSVAGHASCAEMAARRTQVGGDKSAFLSGCEETKRRLDTVDARRQIDADYRAGFSGGAKAAPLSPPGSLVPGTILPPPPRDRP
jgi:hypothetical protein